MMETAIINYIIRPVVGRDFDSVRELIHAFHREALHEFGLSCESAQINATINECFNEALALEVDGKVVGVIAGKVVDYPLQEAKIFQEMIWYVAKDYRRYGIKLLEVLEERCRSRGMAGIVMVLLENSKSGKLGRFYEKMGYKPLEKHFIKGL